MKRIYISGPMTGLPELNFPAFNAEANRLRELGYDVVNPVDLNPPTETDWHECMRRDLAGLLTCDTLALLDGWQRSTGAHLEMHVAHRVGMEIVIAKEVVPAVSKSTRAPYRRRSDDMDLPAGKTCNDCVHCKRCCGMFGHIPQDETCDWSPSKFRAKEIQP